jgi:hypothetical protein
VYKRQNQDTVPFPSNGFDDFSSTGPDSFNDGFGGNDDFGKKPTGRDLNDF